MANARFPTTHWSLVVAAGATPSPRAEEALAELCARYWPPVFAFVRRHCRSEDEAKDLTQGFFARLLEKRDVGDADRARGRFRSFLLAACRHFLANQHDRAQARKRGGGVAAVSLDAEDAPAIVDGETPERHYERRWCLTLLGAALDDVRADYEGSGRAALFARLRDGLTGEVDPGEAARDLGMSVAAAKVAVHRLRRRYRDALRRRVADTVAAEADVDDEIRHLLEVFGSARGGL